MFWHKYLLLTLTTRTSTDVLVTFSVHPPFQTCFPNFILPDSGIVPRLLWVLLSACINCILIHFPSMAFASPKLGSLAESPFEWYRILKCWHFCLFWKTIRDVSEWRSRLWFIRKTGSEIILPLMLHFHSQNIDWNPPELTWHLYYFATNHE